MGERTLLGCVTLGLNWRRGIGVWRAPELRAWKLLQVDKLPSSLFTVICKVGNYFQLGAPCWLNVSTVTHSLIFRSGNSVLGYWPRAHSKGRVLPGELSLLLQQENFSKLIKDVSKPGF